MHFSHITAAHATKNPASPDNTGNILGKILCNNSQKIHKNLYFTIKV